MTMQKLLSKARKAIQDFDMIQENDKIAVGLSGGKDSLTLLHILKNYQRFSPQKFELIAITLNPGGVDNSPLYKLCKDLDIEFHEVQTDIKEIVFDIRKEKNPCSLCANLRRGALNDTAKKLGCTKVALGHHKDDAIETFIMSLFYEGRDDGWKEAPAEIKGTYLDNFKNVWDLYINNSKYDKKTLATGGYDAEAEFKKGEAVFYQNGTWEYDALKKSISDDDMQMIPIYCGVEGEEKAGLCSGTENCWAVNAKASKADQKATLEFMKWLVTSKEGTKVMAEQFGAIPYKKAADSGNVFLKNANDLLVAGNYNVDWSFNYTPNVDEWRASLVAAMNKYDAGGSWDDVKTAFVQGWATQYKAANK